MSDDRLVLVQAVALDDLCMLAERAVERLNVMTPGPEDSLAIALRGSVREVRAHSLLEPAS
jgi:hypothetical protein